MESERKQKRGHHAQVQFWITAVLLFALFMTFNLSASAVQYVSISPSNGQKLKIAKKAVPTVQPTTFSALPIPTPTPSIPHILPGDWPDYLMDNGGFNGDETQLTPETAPQLHQFWTYHAGGGISDEPVVADGLIFWGSWDGFEHATSLNGQEVWKTNLGTTTDYDCDPPSVGVASTAAVAPLTIHGKVTLVVFVGGGNANFYALNAANGKVIWQNAFGFSPDYFIWSSPVMYNGSVYIGISSFGDCPSIQGQLVQMDAATGAVQNVFDVVPNGCIGGSIWGSPTLDASTGTLYVATGNSDSCWTYEVYAVSIIELQASNLAVVGSWQVSPEQQVYDSDFGSTPTLFTATTGGVARPMVGVVNKNGIYYAFKRGAISDGPVWSDRVGYATGDCDECISGSMSPSAWDGQRLYVAGNNATVKKTFCVSTVIALDPATGNYLWEWCIGYRIFGAIITVPGLVMLDAGPYIVILNAANGKVVFSYKDTDKDALFYGPPSVAHGVLYAGGMDGKLFALGVYQSPNLQIN